ncbi:MAG TPA: SDR family NAD(P)-dependent oxidoreductase [Puia sp.]|nr:SDR family NAD(P)-dependent oxidoreductase [Puia sp.]
MSKVIIIGATSGIGRELARRYAAGGHLVGATGRRQELLATLAAEYPGRVVTACYDATGRDAISESVSLAERLGGMDLLIYNAGWGEFSAGLDWDIDKQTVDINVNGFLMAVHFGWDHFIRQGHGHLVTISSVAGNRGNRYTPAYSAAKSFQSVYFEGLYIKARRLNIPLYVTDIQPGFVNTQLAKGPRFWVASVDQAADQIVRAIARRRRKAYITRRWWIVAKLFRWIPGWVYYRL